MPASSSSRPIWLRRWCCCRKTCSSSTDKEIGQPRRLHHNKGLFNWRDEQVGDFETLVKTFLTPRRVVRVVSEFILFTRKDEEFSKVVLRPHQMRAVERCVSRCRDKEKRRGLVWHTQGSGKTHTMITVAKRLIEDEIFDNPTVLMLVDRNELESQLFQNLQQVAVDYLQVSSKREQEVRKSFYKALISSGAEGVVDLAQNILRMLRRASS